MSLAKAVLIGVGGCIGVGAAWPYRDDFRIVRVSRTAKTTVSIISDYGYTLRGLQENSSEYERVMSEVHKRSAIKMLDLACRNRGTYIKIGQLLGAMDYLLPKEYVHTLKVLHSDAPTSKLSEIEKVIKDELGVEHISDIFSDFSPEPLGTASLAQVHKAKLKSTGEVVAVKVQHPRVRKQADNDIATMEKGVIAASYLFPSFKMMWLVDETKKHLPLELDFLHESGNCEKVAEFFKNTEWIKIPKVYRELSSERVLVMELCEGGQINNLDYFRQNHIDANRVMKMVGKMYSDMIFINGFVHCDPHPGNFFVRKRSQDECREINKKIYSNSTWTKWIFSLLRNDLKCSEIELVLLDHGLYQTLDADFRYHYANLWQGLITSDLQKIQEHSKAMGVEDAYPLFSTMLTARSWDVIQNHGIDRVKMTAAEDQHIREGVGEFLPDISHILNKVPPPMIMVFKTNDLIRSLEIFHGTRADSSGFLYMSECCIRCLHRFERKKIKNENFFAIFKLYLNLRFKLLQLSMYEWYLWIINLQKRGQLQQFISNKEFRDTINRVGEKLT